jgi:hypothetical protein
MPDVTPLALMVPAEAQTRIEDAATWLASLSDDAVDRFRAALEVETTALCQSVAEQIAAGSRLIPDEQASLAYSRPVYLSLFTTTKTKRRRRSASGTWRVYYDLMDLDGDGVADTLRLLTVRHAAARPIWDVDTAE